MVRASPDFAACKFNTAGLRPYECSARCRLLHADVAHVLCIRRQLIEPLYVTESFSDPTMQGLGTI